MKSVKGQSCVQKQPFFFFSPNSLGYKPEVSCTGFCRWLFICLKRHVSTQHGKRSMQKARKLKDSLYLQSPKVNTEKPSFSLL